MEIERVGDTFNLYYIDFLNGDRILFGSMDIEMEDPVYVGLAVSASEASASEGTATVEGVFREVEFEGTTDVSEWEIY